jgi:ABC-2 type transport system permease protein
LSVITRLNPATYGVDAIRRVVLPESVEQLTISGWVVPIWADALITLGFGTAMLLLAVRLFARTE